MTTPESDFDAAKAVADLLKGMDKQRRERILRWVAESLNLDLMTALTPEPRMGEADPGSAAHQPQPALAQTLHRPQRSPDIKSFVASKQPKSDVQFAAVVAYYYRFEASAENRNESINAQALQEAARLANRRRLPNPKTTLNNAKRLGYLDSSDRGQFRINNVGENLVAMTLPGTESEIPRRKSRARRSPKAKAKKP